MVQMKRGLRLTLTWLCVIGVVACAFVIGSDLYERYRTEKLDESVRKLYMGNAATAIWRSFSPFLSAYAETGENAAPDAAANDAQEVAVEEEKPAIHEDFQMLYEENEDIVGWLKLGDRIDYPVVKRDNDFYLTHNFYGRKDSNGTLFVNMYNELWPRDDVLLIHGHNMRSGAMFGTLLRYERYDYLKKHPVVTFRTIYDEQDVYYVPVAGFNASMIPDNKDYFDITRINFEDGLTDGNEDEGVNGTGNENADETANETGNGNEDENEIQNETVNPEHQAYLDDLRAWSLWESPFDVNVEDELLMLVTCSYKNEDGRFMLVCRKLRDGETVDMIQEIFEQS